MCEAQCVKQRQSFQGTHTNNYQHPRALNLWMILLYKKWDNYNTLYTRVVAALINVNQKCDSVAGEVAGTFLRDMQSVTPAFQANVFQ